MLVNYQKTLPIKEDLHTVPCLFGTDGIRGKFGEYPILPDILGDIAVATLDVLGGGSAVVGYDGRESGLPIKQAIIDRCLTAGFSAQDIGLFPSGGVSFASRSKECIGFMVSASHNTFHDNGIKIFNKNGYKINRMEEIAIEDTFFRITQGNYNNKTPVNVSKRLVKPIQEFSYVISNEFLNEYSDKILNSLILSPNFRGETIVIDCANGAFSRILKSIFTKAGASKIVVICSSPDGRNINRSCGAIFPVRMAQVVKEVRAACGIAVDGDGDRCVICDADGKVIDGNIFIAAIAYRMISMGIKNATRVATTSIANGSLGKFIAEIGADLLISPFAGDSALIRMMLEENCAFGGEICGHFLFPEKFPVSDGAIGALNFLGAIEGDLKTGLHNIHGLLRLMPQRFKNLPCSKNIGNSFIQSDELQSIIAKLKNRGVRSAIRMSGTEAVLRVMTESVSVEDTDHAMSEIVSSFVNFL